ncbi:thioesterase II family protein [Paenibacillus amylolyticus]|uniref:thioesterase II family protein n=1 Tax=Paenibacillus amylolyticus TaxID=1451 RepID=UPI003EBED9FC
MGNIKLICIPYAGGSKHAYRNWSKYLNDSVELNAVELAGRGRRFLEPGYEDMNAAVDDVYHIVKPLIQNSDYAIFGHSMGSIIAYELIHRLKGEGLHDPEHAFFSGRYPPFIKKDDPSFHDAPLEAFIEELLEMGGTPKVLLENEEFIDTFVPIIRSDYRIVETYCSPQRDSKYEFDISILNGNQDKGIEPNDLEMWKSCTSGKCRIHEFDGGHFFINEQIEDVTKIINDVLTPEVISCE